MVCLSSVSGAGGALYLEIRRVELKGDQAGASFLISGMVGDGCDEAFIRAELGESSSIDIMPICSDDLTAGTLDERIGMSELKQLVSDALAQIYFCVDAPPRNHVSGRVSGYADGGRLIRLCEPVGKPHQSHRVAESEPLWDVA